MLSDWVTEFVGRVNRDGTDRGGRVPSLQQRLRHHQFADGGRVDAAGNDLAGELRVFRLRLFQHVQQRRHEVEAHQMVLRGELADKGGVAQHHLVVSAGKTWAGRHVVIRRRLDQDDPDAGQMLLQGLNDVLIAVGVGGETLLIERLVFPVVHAEHDGDDVGLEREDVALQPQVNRPGPAADDPVPADAGVDKLHLQVREIGCGRRFPRPRRRSAVR